MLRGYRGVIVAVAGLSLIVMAMGIGAYFGALYSPHKKQYQTVSSGNASGAEYRGPSQSLSDISGIPGPAERAIANPQPTSGEDHEKRDLAAQESMSVWAFWMMLVAAFSAIVTTIGTVFLYKQIRLTREAVEDTGKATLAMERQNRLTEDSQRPWIMVRCNLVDFKRTGKHITCQIDVEFENIGKTLAHDFYYSAGLDVINPKFDNMVTRAERRFDKAKEKREGDNSVLMPGEVAQSQIRSNFSFREDSRGLVPTAVIVSGAAHYRVSPDANWSETEASFLFCGPDQFDMAIFPSIEEGAHDGSTVFIRRHITGNVT